MYLKFPSHPSFLGARPSPQITISGNLHVCISFPRPLAARFPICALLRFWLPMYVCVVRFLIRVALWIWGIGHVPEQADNTAPPGNHPSPTGRLLPFPSTPNQSRQSAERSLPWLLPLSVTFSCRLSSQEPFLSHVPCIRSRSCAPPYQSPTWLRP